MIKHIIDFYYDGFSNMRTGKTLWLVVIVKLVIIFFVIRLFFMPDVIGQRAADGQEAEYVSSQITERAGIQQVNGNQQQ